MFGFWKCLSITLNWVNKIFAGIDIDIKGQENLIQQRVIYAVRHESLWETLSLIYLFDHPIFIMKQELFDIPIFCAMAKKTQAIGIDRNNAVKSLTSTAKQVKKYIDENRVIVIFPEGTRLPSGKYEPLKRGIALLYKLANCPVVPIIHNSGEYWSKRSFIKHPGTIKVRIKKAILPGLNQNEFMRQLNQIFKDEIELLKKEG